MDICFYFSSVVGSYSRCILTFQETVKNCFPVGLHHFSFLPTICSDYSPSISVLDIVRFSDVNRSSRSEVGSRCGFDPFYPHD